MEPLNSAEQRKIRILLNHISGYTDIIRTDALLLGRARLAEYFRQVFSETVEIKHIIMQAFPGKGEEELLVRVVREEVARHLYVSMYLLIQLQKELPPEDYQEFEYEIQVIRSAVTELVLYFEKILNITSESLAEVSVKDITGTSGNGLARYFPGINEAAGNADSGGVLVSGTGASVQHLQELLSNRGYRISVVEAGEDIRTCLSVYDINLICVELEGDGIGTFQLIRSLRNDPLFHDIPLVVCADFSDKEMELKVLHEGAIEFFTPDKDEELMLAHMQAAVLFFRENYRRHLYIRALESGKYRMSKELSSAASYVAGMLPPPQKNDLFSVDWAFLPSQDLGGDIFGYSWLSPTQFAVYLLDVSGHGLEASLFSVTVMNLLSRRLLRTADFADPASVLTELNRVFRIEEQNNMYFTAWYGVFNTQTRLLTYSSAGSQPAILYPPETPAEKLNTGGLIVGVDPDTEYTNAVRFIAPGSRVYIFSDGIFEIKKSSGQMMSLAEFIQILGVRDTLGETCRQFVSRVEAMSKSGRFDDDVSMLELSFFGGTFLPGAQH